MCIEVCGYLWYVYELLIMTILKFEYSIDFDFLYSERSKEQVFLGSLETLLIIAGIFDTCTF